MGYEPSVAVALVVAAAAALGWKIARVARLPRILAEGGREAAVVSSMGGGQPVSPAGRADRRLWMHDVPIDRQLTRPLPTATSAAAGFADMLRRPQSRLTILLTVAYSVLSVLGGLAAISAGGGQSLIGIVERVPQVLTTFASISAAVAVSLTAGMWWQRRNSLMLDFLRPVSRRDYWLGLRAAVARDLAPPLVVAAAGVVGAAIWWGQGRVLPWLVSGLGFVGVVAVAHAMVLLIAIGRRPLIAATIAIVVLVVAAFGLLATVFESISYGWYGEPLPFPWWRAVAGAAVLLAAGLAIRAAVLWRLEDREIA
jgi:hypothetical protein